MDRYNSILYSRGYIFSDQKSHVPNNYSMLIIDGYYFYHDSNTSAYVSRDSAGNWVIVYGVILNSKDGTSNIAEISEKLLTLRRKSKTDYLNYLDILGGRYLIIVKYNKSINVYNDACGNQIVNYIINTGRICASSHLELLKDNFSLEISGVEKERVANKKNFRYGYPGMSTPYKNIKKLIPNTTINLLTKNINRYFPRENLNVRTVEESYINIKKLFNTQFESLLSIGSKPLISLTAGWDSRFTISLLNDFKKADYFTYRSFDAHDIDVAIAKVIASRLEVNHTVLCNKKYSFKGDYDNYNKIISLNTYVKHGRQVSYMYFNEFKSENYTHIRSNLSEIGRFYYGECKDYQLNELSLLFLWGSINKDYVSSQVVRNSFREFFVKNKYFEIYNYNAFDLFYWEHRMGQWNSEVLIEGDPAFNTIQLFNCREVLKNLLAVPIEDRKNDSIYKYAIFNKGRASLLDIPLNPSQIEFSDFFEGIS